MAQESSVPKIIHSQPNQVGVKQGKQGVCAYCGLTFTSSTNRGQLYCGKSCSRRAMWASKTQEERNEITSKTASKLLGRPSWNKGVPCREETKRKLSAAHKTSGHKPKVQGGNGRVAPCEAMLREMLQPYWISQYSVKTNKPRGSGYAAAYKLDFALPFKKWGLEVDGNSHTARKHLDAKKDSLLASLGWCIFRVTNAQVRAWYTTFKSMGHITILLPEN